MERSRKGASVPASRKQVPSEQLEPPQQENVRCDKVTFLLDMEPDRFQTYLKEFEEFTSHISLTTGVPINSSARVRGADPERGTRLYELDTYGAGSDHLLRALPAHWISFISRLDYRTITNINVDNLYPLQGHLERNARRGRNVNMFNTRERTKLRGRNAGGRGVSVGSHKSDQRLVIYKRKGEQGAIELHVTGMVLQREVKRAKMLVSDGKSSTFYDAIMWLLYSRLHSFIQDCGFSSLGELSTYLSAPSEGDAAEASRYAAIAELRNYLARAGKTERQSIARELGINLNDIMGGTL